MTVGGASGPLYGTPLMELYGMVRAAHRLLETAGVQPIRHLTSSYVTFLEMAGCSISLSLLDEELTRLWRCAGPDPIPALGVLKPIGRPS